MSQTDTFPEKTLSRTLGRSGSYSDVVFFLLLNEHVGEESPQKNLRPDIDSSSELLDQGP